MWLIGYQRKRFYGTRHLITMSDHNFWRYDDQSNDTWRNDVRRFKIEHHGTQHNDTQPNVTWDYGTQRHNTQHNNDNSMTVLKCSADRNLVK
jgi:hypothetical protein